MFNVLKKILFIILIFSLVAWLDPFKDEVSKGNSYFSKGKFSDAKKAYENAKKFAPDEEKKLALYFNIGDANMMLGDNKEALNNFKKALNSKNPDVQKKSFFNMGNIFSKDKKYKEAVKSYINALKIDPKYKKAKKNLEYLLRDKKNKNKNKDKNKKENQKQDKNNDKKDKKDSKKNKQKQKMSKKQLKNILDSMKNRPIRREKGKGNGQKVLKKYW